MPEVTCPNCNNSVPVNRYCIFCGERIEEITTCMNCEAVYFSYLPECPVCSTPGKVNTQILTIKPTPWYIRRLLPLESSLLIIFILSSYFIFQLIVGTLVILFLPFEVFDDTVMLDFFNLLITIITNLIFVLVLFRYSPFILIKINPVQRKKQITIIIGVIFLVSLALLEINVILIDFILDFFSVPSAHSSPYDGYFANPLVTFLFSLLVIFIGPLFEEVIFRKHVISFLDDRIASKLSVILVSSTIFSLNHLPADLQNGSFRFTIEHLSVVFFLGIVLAIIYYKYGLLYAVFFHSLWNSFSLLAQLGVSTSEITAFLDILLLISYILTLVLSINILIKIKQYISNFLLSLRNYKIFTLENGLFIANATIIIIFELLNAFLLNLDPNTSGIGIILLLGFHAIGIVIGFLIFEYKSKNRYENRIMLGMNKTDNIPR